MNVLVYNGPGSTPESVKHATESLRKLLSPYYSVHNVDAEVIKNEPWTESTALLVMPGGADLPYCTDLNGIGNKVIRNWVRAGGKYLGFCAGGYFGAQRVEFEEGTDLEVMGDRELSLYGGKCVGSAYKGFVYDSHAGARAVGVNWQGSPFKCYFNGGGVFIPGQNMDAENTEVVAEYSQDTEVPNSGRNAVVKMNVGEGKAVLSGIHPEFNPNMMKKGDDHIDAVIGELESFEKERVAFLRHLMTLLGLKTNPDTTDMTLTSIYVTGRGVEKLLKDLDVSEEKRVFSASNDTFFFGDKSSGDAKHTHVIPMAGDVPASELTPHFDHKLYYQSLLAPELGSTLLYGEVLTSTSTLLDKNYNLLRHLPNGFTAVGTVQLSGRGRGNNVWVNPIGVLAVSTVLRISFNPFGQNTSIIFVQYLASLAMVQAIKNYGPGYSEVPVKLKWPNDIYAANPGSEMVGSTDAYLKIGGVIVNSNVFDGQYMLVVGCGVNVSNSAPTTSLNLLVNSMNEKNGTHLEHYRTEVLLAKFLETFEAMMDAFKNHGFSIFEPLYYASWLHRDAQVRLEHYGNVKATVKGISMDQGMLLVQEEGSGRVIELQPDGNSFDMMRGLLKRKE